MDLYTRRGVSAQKEDVHAATKNLDQGLYPRAFCKIYKDVLCGEEDWVNLMHADGAGTKSILAYLYWKETGDLSIWKGIAQDAVVMNLDDLLCAGIYDNILFSSTIDRNKNFINAAVLETVIMATQSLFDEFKKFGIGITYMGGETADVGDVVRTIAVNGTMTARWPKAKIISNEKIADGDVIVGLAGFGQSAYELEYNSGIGSNGLTSARHDMLDKSYGISYPESFDGKLDESVVYIGTHRLTEKIEINPSQSSTFGKLLLSPTRSFAPVIKQILENHFESVHGLVHCSGGGQTKCLKYIPGNVRVIKDNLFVPPVIFRLIQQSSKASDREMYQVFNMGTRMEIYCSAGDAEGMINIAENFGVDAQIIGRVEKNEKAALYIRTNGVELSF